MAPEEIEKLLKALEALELVKAPDPGLNQKCEPIEGVYPHSLLGSAMLEVMRKSNGIGLAAPQVGLPIRFLVAEVDGKNIQIANPEILEMSDEKEWSEEGCLSFPGIYVPVLRAKEIKLKGMVGELQGMVDSFYSTFVVKGLMARVIQHEIDHLDGICHISYLDRNERRRIMSVLKKQKKKDERRKKV